MSRKPIDILGQRFGRWTVLSRAANIGTRAVWHCRCDCGAEADVRGDALRRGKSLSCGCLAMEHSIAVHRSYNTYVFCGDYVEVYTNKGEKILIDSEDLDKIKDVYWYVCDTGYARSKVDGKHIRMHQLILPAPKGKIVDHISGDTLDNRKCNLRLCTMQQNTLNCRLRKDNTSGVKGVSIRITPRGEATYVAHIGFNNKRHNLGVYRNIDDAKAAREKAERELFGEYSRDFGAESK